MIREIQAKVMLSHVKQPDTWFGLKYNMNIYRGCQHQCIYCDSRSECYRIANFDDVLVKVNAVDLLRDEMARKRVKGTIGTGSMSDPYTWAERRYNLTGRALEAIAEFGFGVHIITKSDMVLKDLAALKAISRVYAAVSFTITTTDDDLARKVEPGAPLPSQRLDALATLAANGIYAGVVMMPVLPFLEDSTENIAGIVQQAHAHGAAYIIPAFGMTLRDRQRAHYYAALDRSFPGMSAQYRRRYGSRYYCAARDVDALQLSFEALCDRCGIATAISVDIPPRQLSLF